MLGISGKTLDRLVAQESAHPGATPAGGHRRFRISDLAALVGEAGTEDVTYRRQHTSRSLVLSGMLMAFAAARDVARDVATLGPPDPARQAETRGQQSRGQRPWTKGLVSVGLGLAGLGPNFESAGGGSTPPGAIRTRAGRRKWDEQWGQGSRESLSCRGVPTSVAHIRTVGAWLRVAK
jgi:hypothetical protein